MSEKSILKEKNFLLFWVGSFLSGLGDSMFLITASWMVVKITRSGTILGILMGTMSLSQMLFSLIGGALVDRTDPKVFMLASGAIRMVAMLFLVIVSFGTMPPLWALFVVATVFGTADAIFWPAAMAFKQSQVRPNQYVQANGILMMAWQTTQIIGPALAGILAASGHFDDILVINAAIYGTASACLALIKARRNETPIHKKSSMLGRDIADAFRYVRRTPLLLVTSLSAFVVNACLAAVMVAIPLVAHELRMGSQGFGFMTAALGTGGALGAIAFSIIRIRRPTPRMTLISTGIEGLLFIMLGLVHHLTLLVVLLCLVGIVEVAVNTIAPSVNQRIIPPSMFGRVISLIIVLMSASEPVAKATSGWIMARVGVAHVLWWAGTLELLVSITTLFIPVVQSYSRGEIQGSG